MRATPREAVTDHTRTADVPSEREAHGIGRRPERRSNTAARRDARHLTPNGVEAPQGTPLTPRRRDSEGHNTRMEPRELLGADGRPLRMALGPS